MTGLIHQHKAFWKALIRAGIFERSLRRLCFLTLSSVGSRNLHETSRQGHVRIPHFVPPTPSVFSSLVCSEQPQPFKGLHAGGVDSHRYVRLLVRLHPEPLLQRSHEEDDEGPGRLTEG